MKYNTNCGIYKITNLVDGKFYIGSSNDLKRRSVRHFSELKNNKHHSLHLQRAFNKYGREYFVFEVLEYTKEEELLIVEQKYLDNLKPYDYNIGYNISILAKSPTLPKGENHPNFGKCGNSNAKSVGVVQLDMNYKYLNTFESMHIAQEKTGADASTIAKACKGKKKSVKGFRWLYSSDYATGNYTKETNKPKRPVIQLTLDDAFLNTFESINEAGRKTELNYKSIHACCNGTRKSCGGYKWMYLEEYEKTKSAN